MVDIENELFTIIANELRLQFPGINIAGEYVKTPSSFPHVTIMEEDNSSYKKTEDSCGENHSQLMYEINVYSNKQSGKKAECKSIFKAIDEILSNLGFSRMTKRSIPNLEDSTIHRMLGRYTAIVNNNKIIYRG